MKEKQLEIINKLGLHARPASLIVQTAMQFNSVIKIEKDEFSVDAKSIMGIMMLAAAKGTKLTFRIEGSDEQEAMNKMEELFKSGFGEEI